jgi:hypothetical protein
VYISAQTDRQAETQADREADSVMTHKPHISTFMKERKHFLGVVNLQFVTAVTVLSCAVTAVTAQFCLMFFMFF